MDHNNNQLSQQKSYSGGLSIHVFVFNPVQENTYVIWDETAECAIVDAGCFTRQEFDKLDQFIRSNHLKPIKLINTHGHFDHIFGIEQCRKAYQLKWEAHPGDDQWIKEVQSRAAAFGIPIEPISLPEVALNDGDEVCFGHTVLKILYAPGHSTGSICFYEEQSKIVITGDVLFNGSIGRSDLSGGNYQTLITSIQSKLLPLPDETRVFPGHGPSTTIGNEKTNNPYL